jgi:hypothetical protein
MNVKTSIAATALICMLPLSALAQNHGGHPAPPPSHPQPVHAAPPPHPAPAAHPVQHVNAGFNLPHDVPSRGAPAQRAPAQRMPTYQTRPAARGRTIGNPRNWTRPWQWNNGVVWAPAPLYWGGGFWGPFAFGLALGDYIAEPDTPGYILLENYGLTQTPCGPPNLVVIFGPDGSEICAYPNNLVAPGEYSVDPTTLTLVSY